MTAKPVCPNGALGLQLGFWRARTIPIWPQPVKVQKPRPHTKRHGAHRLALPNLREGVRVTIRLGPNEAQQLAAIALEEGESLSETIRYALYETYRVGELVEAVH